MIPPFTFDEIIREQLLRDDRSIHVGISADIEDSLTREQSQGLRVSDVGSCSLALWAKVNGLLDLPRNPQDQWSRLMAGSMFGALLGRIFQAGCAARHVVCELEVDVTVDGMSGHVDCVLPEYEHLYELKSNYGTKVFPPSRSHWLQAGMYASDLGEHYTASIVIVQPAISGDRQRIREYRDAASDLSVLAQRESQQLRRAAESVVPPEPDVPADEKTWRCKSCQYSRCALNTNTMKSVAAA